MVSLSQSQSAFANCDEMMGIGTPNMLPRKVDNNMMFDSAYSGSFFGPKPSNKFLRAEGLSSDSVSQNGNRNRLGAKDMNSSYMKDRSSKASKQLSNN